MEYARTLSDHLPSDLKIYVEADEITTSLIINTAEYFEKNLEGLTKSFQKKVKQETQRNKRIIKKQKWTHKKNVGWSWIHWKDWFQCSENGICKLNCKGSEIIGWCFAKENW